MRLVFFGSGAFGLPTLIDALRARHDIALVVTQPDRPAGRHRKPTPTPVGSYAAVFNLPCAKPEDPNEPSFIDELKRVDARAFVVIAYGCKLGPRLCEFAFAINLHGSLLPKYRGAAPINWAIINGETHAGVSVITLAQRMDSGDILASASTRIDPMETAGELHDRLAQLGATPVIDVLDQFDRGELHPQPQDESLVTHARKLTKEDGTTSFDMPAPAVRSRVHGLTPWPGCTVRLGDERIILKRVDVADEQSIDATAGTILPDWSIACGRGSIRALSVQPAGGKTMTLEALARGRRIEPGMRLEKIEHDVSR